MNGGKNFYLPIGLKDEKGIFHRAGVMRPSTALDEIEIQQEEKIRFNDRMRDIFLLCRVITKLGDMENLLPEQILELYEADFIYLQLLFQEINGAAGGGYSVNCPHCSRDHRFDMGSLYRDKTGGEIQAEPVPLYYSE